MIIVHHVFGKLCSSLSGSGSTVRHVCVALRCGSGSVSVDTTTGAERPDAAGGETELSFNKGALTTWQTFPFLFFYPSAARRRCESTRCVGSEMRCEGDPVWQRQDAAVSGELQAQLWSQRPRWRAGVGSHLGRSLTWSRPASKAGRHPGIRCFLWARRLVPVQKQQIKYIGYWFICQLFSQFVCKMSENNQYNFLKFKEMSSNV